MKKKMLVQIAGSVLCLLFLGGTAWGATLYVPDHYLTIQDAIIAASNSDVIIVRCGTYVENINFIGKAIALQSESGPQDTTIDGNQTGSVVVFKNGEGPDSVLEGFTLTNGTGSQFRPYSLSGGGIFCISSSPTILNNIITGNSTDGGGGIYCYDSSPLISGNTIKENSVDWSGGGLYLNNGCASAIVENNTITKNSAGQRGGGFCFVSSTPHFRNNAVSDNSAKRGGGGDIDSPGSPLIEKNLFLDNWVSESSGGGGGIYIYSSSPKITGNLFYRNDGYLEGGALWCSYSSPFITNSVFVSNHARFEGGAIRCVWSNITVTNCTFFANSAHDKGGAICCWDETTLIVTNSILRNDHTSWGGNEIWISSSVYNLPSKLFIGYSNLKGGLLSIYYSLSTILHWGDGMIDANPLYADTFLGDFHLTWNSPCRDAGYNGAPSLPDEDFEGDPRVADNVADIGADEFDTHIYTMGTITPGGTIQVRVIGMPNMPVTAYLGSGIKDPPMLSIYGDIHLLPPLKVYLFETTSADGIAKAKRTIPLTWVPGDNYPIQALVGPVGGNDTELSNLMIMTPE